MAKKRSKTSKQKQAKAVASRRGPKIAAAAAIQGGRGSMLTTGKNGTTKIVIPSAGGNKEANRQEQIDFKKQMRGLEERSAWTRHRMKNESTMIRNKKKKNQSTTPFFQKATFDMNDKHHQVNKTTQLIEQTTQSLHENQFLGRGTLLQSQVIAAPVEVQLLPPKTNKLQIMAAQQRLAWEEESNLETDNPYAALAPSLEGDDDDDDIIHAQSTTITKQPLFQFAPPSFAVHSNNSDYKTTITSSNHYRADHHHNIMDDDEMDPDL